MITIPVQIPGAVTLKGSGDEKRGKIADLSVFYAPDGAIYSAWRPSFREIVRLVTGEPIVVGVLSVHQPPITVKIGLDVIPRIG